ncbi:MAG: hypothetical protein K6E84_07115 [Lachnospiraceae bacterium]|nr:hypothetical protein [Lachnospiraceae bacterium]
MADERQILLSEESLGDIALIVKKLRRQIALQSSLLGQIEKMLGKYGPEDNPACRETSGYEAGEYMPDYVLDEKGFIVDVLPRRVRITVGQQSHVFTTE